MRSFLFYTFILCLTGVASVRPGSSQIRSPGPANQVLQQLFERNPDVVQADERQTAAGQAAEARYQRVLFYGKAKHFVDLWGKLTRELERNTVDVKLARQVSDAFHDLEKTEGWPAHTGK